MLSEDRIKEYQQLFKKKGKEITVEEAEEIDNTFRALAEIIYEQYISDLKQNKKGLDMKDTIWLPITEFLKNNRKLNLLSQLSNSQVFEITEITNDYIKIQFQDSKGDLKIERSRFVSAYKMLEEKKGVWVALGASRTNTKPNTLEGRIKLDYNNKLNGLSTVSWLRYLTILNLIMR